MLQLNEHDFAVRYGHARWRRTAPMAREHADTALGGYDVCASSAVAVNCGTLQ
jgi:hypothetical protein